MGYYVYNIYICRVNPSLPIYSIYLLYISQFEFFTLRVKKSFSARPFGEIESELPNFKNPIDSYHVHIIN